MKSATVNGGGSMGEDAMPALSANQVQFYKDHGYFAPVRALSATEAAAMRRKLEEHEAGNGKLAGPLRHKSHLLFTWLDELVRHPGILDAVESIIGPNILLWGSSFFIKDGRDPGFVSWHQDSTYWGLDPADIVTAWVALSESTVENGAMRVIPDTHLLEQVPHRDTFAEGNLLSRGQEIEVDVDGARAQTLVLQPGEMSLHHVRLIHGSDPNPSDRRRIGFAIRYLPTYVRQVVGTHDSATLVRGVDEFHNFEPEQRPDADFSPAARAFHAQITGAHQQILMRDTGRTAAA
jgi:non-haem Fe2+, alpha-ketoglutarate-dependent halogenase